MDQRGLVERAGRGDHDAFAVLARGAVARLDAVARLILREADLARDAVQEAGWRIERGVSGHEARLRPIPLALDLRLRRDRSRRPAAALTRTA